VLRADICWSIGIVKTAGYLFEDGENKLTI